MALKNSLMVVLFMAIVAMQSPLLVAGQPSAFTLTFNATDTAIGSYNNFIKELRQRVANPAQYTRTIPMLRPQSPTTGPWFHIVLQNGLNIITMRLRLDNIYFVGFRVGNDGGWWEFKPRKGNDNVIPNSNFLPFEGRYESMGNLAEISVGRAPIREAVDTLTQWDGTSGKTSATALACLRLIVVICEAARFQTISNFVYDAIHKSITIKVGAQNADLIHAWGGISKQLIQSDSTARFSAFSRFQIDFPAQAAAVVALVAVANPDRSSNIRLRTSNKIRILSADATGVASLGRQLLEIYSVQVLNIDGENSGNLYGTIQVTDDLDTPVYIYNRQSSDVESIRPNEYATLTGPSRALSALDDFNIDINLINYHSTSSSHEVSKGQIGWNYYDASNVYNQPISEVINGKYGSIAINYAIFGNAVAAIVQITLINGDGKNPAKVNGTVKSSTSLVPNSIDLFNKINKEYVNVKPRTLIPLTRSVVVVPLGSSVKITADLWDYDTSSSHAIAQGSAVFVAQNMGDVTSSIKGKYGEISVKISWSSNWV